VKINEEVLAKKTGLTSDKVVEQLKKLEAYHFLSYAQCNDKPQVLFLSEFVDSKHFGLSKENYYDRKKDAEERVKAVIDFVNNEEECRSVQLLRYFNEKTRKTCGRCDVCMRQGKHRVAYDTVEEKLESVMHETAQPMREVLEQCREFDESQVLDAIRFLVDNGVLQVERDGSVRRKDNKKSRHH
jgi:ATP-dependent DNA helicase RecQ